MSTNPPAPEAARASTFLPAGAVRTEFASDGETLRGWLFTAPLDVPRPIIVMAPGWTAVKEMFLDLYAQVFVETGFHVLVYDHRNFGESTGRPRQEIDPVAQVRGYRDAITYAQSLPGVDPNAVGVWGSSYSGGHVLTVAAFDRRVKCVVSQCPTISGWRNTLQRYSQDVWAGMIERFAEDRRDRYAGGPDGMTPALPGQPPPSDPTRTHFGNNGPAWFQNIGPERLSTWGSEITLRSVEMYAEYEPGAAIARISPTPMLMIVAEKDIVTPTQEATAAFAEAGEPKKLVLAPGGHFDIYGEAFALSSTAAAQWFAEFLPTPRPARASGRTA